MGDSNGRPDPGLAFDPRVTPLPRRRMLLLMGASAVAGSAALGAFLQACAAPPVIVALDVDPASLVPGVPTEVPFTLARGSDAIPGSAWLVRRADGKLTAFDPRCTHGLCKYAWSQDGARFKCHCHDGQYALDGAVLAGPPPKPLGQFPVREVAGRIEVDVPGDFQTPRESLPA